LATATPVAEAEIRELTGTHEIDRNFAVRGGGTTVVGDAKTQTGPNVSEQDFGPRFETVDWSQARYDEYGFIALDVTPAAIGPKTTMACGSSTSRAASSTGSSSPVRRASEPPDADSA
jgi:hypothetical protein